MKSLAQVTPNPKGLGRRLATVAREARAGQFNSGVALAVFVLALGPIALVLGIGLATIAMALWGLGWLLGWMLWPLTRATSHADR